jgi:hypothetical protein
VEDEVECTHKSVIKYDANPDSARAPGRPGAVTTFTYFFGLLNIEKPFPDGVDHGFHPGMQVQLLKNVADVILDGVL